MLASMAAASDVLYDSPAIRIYADGRYERFPTDFAPAGVDAATGVDSKDVVINADTGLSVRLYLPDLKSTAERTVKLPILVYFHGGGFVAASPALPMYHAYLNALAAHAGVLAVSVDYRLAPEHRLPAAYEDSSSALEWALSCADPWLAEHGDTRRVFLAGDSSGGNIAFNVAMEAGRSGEAFEGLVLLHAAMLGKEPLADEEPEVIARFSELWSFVFPTAENGMDDPRINPLAATAPGVKELRCRRLLVCETDGDVLRHRVRAYYDALAASAWGGTADWFYTEGEEHCFFLFSPDGEPAAQLMHRLVQFFAGE